MIDRIDELRRKAMDNWRRIYLKKRIAKKIISECAFPVRSGLWVIGPEFSRNHDVRRLPPPLDTVKSWGDWRKGKILKALVHFSEVLIYPWITRASGPAKGKFVADVVLINRLNDLVGFDLAENKVIKSMTSHQIKHLETGVLHLTKIYTCVPFQINHETGYVFEDMISGCAFSVVSDEMRIKSVARFLDGLLLAPSLALDMDAICSWQTACRVLLPQIPCSDLPLSKIEKYIGDIILNAKTSWVHGDLFGENIIVTDTGEVVIDYDKSGIAPTFTDIMTLFVFEARTLRYDLMDTFFNGGFDQEFDIMGCRLNGDESLFQKVAMFITWLGWKTTTEDFSSINIRRFFDVLEKYLGKNIPMKHVHVDRWVPSNDP
jgi:Phosphotransferase enzyme family